MTEIDVIIQRLVSIEQSVDRVAKAVELQNGRIGTIERVREREAGAREAVALAAAQQAAQMAQQAKSRGWWVGVIAAFAGSAAAIATVAGVLAQLLYHGHP